MPENEISQIDPRSPITQILAMTDNIAREAALKQIHEQERIQLLKNPYAFSEKDVPYLTKPSLVVLVAQRAIDAKQYAAEMLRRQKSSPNAVSTPDEFQIKQNLETELRQLKEQETLNSALEKKQMGRTLTHAEKHSLSKLNTAIDKAEISTVPVVASIQKELEKQIDQTVVTPQSLPNITTIESSALWELARKNQIPYHEYEVEVRRRDSLLSPPQSSASPSTQARRNPDTIPSAMGIRIEYRNLTPKDARSWITTKVPTFFRGKLNDQLDEFESEGGPYSVSIGKDAKGIYQLVKFQLPSPWTNVKREAQQSVTREIRREVGKQGNRLINPDYAHNEMMNQFKLVRAALPGDTAVKKALDKTDSVVSAVLTSTGLAAEATNLLVNAIRGALLESPELKYKVAALVPDDLVRQGYVATVRTAGNTLREFIHKKYNLPDRPKKTPVLVNTLDQIKPEHYRAQDAQKVGITMRDLTRENAIKFIHENVPVEKQESAIETIGKLKGNQFGVSIMDSGWVRIDASAREPRAYDNRPQYDNRQKWVGSYDDTKMP